MNPCGMPSATSVILTIVPFFTSIRAGLNTCCVVAVMVTWTTGGESSAWIPCRYPASETASDDRLRLARLTTWDEFFPGNFRGVGQRMLTSDVEEHPFLEVRLIDFRHG